MHIQKITSGLVLMAFVAVLTVGQTTARGQCRINTIRPPVGVDEVGGTIAADGEYAVMGATGVYFWIDENWSYRTRMVVLERFGNEWIPQGVLMADGAGWNNDHFGETVAISGDYIVVGAKRSDDACPEDDRCDSGAAYVFRRVADTIWIQDGKLLASDITEKDSFGYSLAIDGDTIVVGALDAHNPQNSRFEGAAYVFKRDGSTWVEEAKLTAPPGTHGYDFASAVAISNGRILVGAQNEELYDFGPRPGGAHVFVRGESGWTHEASLLPADNENVGGFGWDVAFDDDVAVIRAWDELEPGVSGGVVYVFREVGSSWVEEARLVGPTGMEFPESFGRSIDTDGESILVGGEQSAVRFEYDGTQWVESAILKSEEELDQDNRDFGHSVAIAGDFALVQSYVNGDDLVEVFGGWGDCDGDGVLDGCEIVQGTAGDCDQDLVPDGCELDDCDADGVPDVCAVLAGAADCNNNAQPDACEIVSGVAADDNDDGLLDECSPSPTLWCEAQELNPIGGHDEEFGRSAAIDGDYAIVGANQDRRLQVQGFTLDGAAYIYHREGSNWVEQAVLLPDVEVEEAVDQFGIAVDIRGDLAVVGMNAGSPENSVYVYRRNGATWVREARLMRSDPDDDWRSGLFGTAVAVSGDLVVVGAPFDNTVSGDVSGSIYVYRYDGSDWAFEAKLLASDLAPGDLLGYSVAVQGDRVVAGIPQDNDLGGNSGSIRVFRREPEGWVEEAKLLTSDGRSGDLFGVVVSMDGDRIIGGASGHDGVDSASGAAYVFRREGTSWIEEAQLFSPNAQWAGLFGSGVVIRGTRALVGAWGEYDAQGNAYVFEREGATWTNTATLIDSDPLPGGRFGWQGAVGLSGDTAIVGAWDRDDPPLGDSGAAYIFELEGTSWSEKVKLINHDPDTLVEFGASVAVSGDRAAAGARLANVSGVARGVIYLYRREGATWFPVDRLEGANDVGDGCGASVAISGDHIAIGCDGNFEVRVYTLEEDWTYDHDETGLPKRLTPDDWNTGAGPTAALSIDGDCTLRGAPLSWTGTVQTGAVDVFRLDGEEWPQEARLLPAEPAEGDSFGQSVALDGDLALVGAPHRDQQIGYDAGSVFVFGHDKSGWFDVTEILPSDAAAFDEFGMALALSGDYLVVTAPGNDERATDAGAAYVFRYDGFDWIEEAKLFASDGLAGDRFGNAVAINGDAIVVAAENDGVGGTGAHTGSAYLFRHDGSEWVEQAVLNSTDSMWWNRRMGSSVAVSEDSVFVGALFADAENVARTGAVYVYDFNFPDCNGNGLHDGCEPDCNANGIPDGCDVPPLGVALDCNLDSVPDECQLFDNDCNANGVPDECDVPPIGVTLDCNSDAVPDECQLLDNDCNANTIPDDCDADINEDGVPDDCCTDNAFCHDDNPCNFDMCVSNVCQYTPAPYGDVAGTGSTCGPDGTVGLSDILAVLDGFQGVFTAGCEVSNVDIASQSDGCAPDGSIDLSDILAVLDAFQGITTCCPGE